MDIKRQQPSASRMQPELHQGLLVLLVAAACVVLPRTAAAQGLTGTLIGTVKDEQDLALAGARVSISSPALIGGPATLTTNEKGKLRFPALPPGPYTLDIEMPGFATLHEGDILIGAGATIERTVVLTVASVVEAVTVEGAGSLIDTRNAGFGSRIGPEDIKAIPTTRSSMFVNIGFAPGISPTSHGTSSSLVSAFGSGANENTYLIDGTNVTATGNGVARTEPGIDFIQEIQIQSVGASAEYGNFQGAVVNVITRQGSNRLLYDASYYGQPAGLTSQPVRCCAGGPDSGYERVRYRDFTTNLGGPVVRDRLWFFTGYQYLRDSDSQPGADASYPRKYKEDKILAKLTWRLAPGWQLMQSVHNENWVNPEVPTAVKRFDATLYQHASIPAINFGHLTHTSSNTVWDVSAGRFAFSQRNASNSGNTMIPSRFDSVTRVTSGAPQQVGAIEQTRSTAKATVSHYQPGLWGADHEWKMGGQFDQGQHHSRTVVPTGVRYVENNGDPVSRTFIDPATSGGQFITAGAFASDAITVGNRLTINAGVRFDRSRAISQDVPAVDAEGRETENIIRGLGTLYTANVVSPRLGVTAKLSADGRTLLRASYGRFSQGVFTGEISLFHPGASKMRTELFDKVNGRYDTEKPTVVDPLKNLQFDPKTRRPRTDEYSIGVDREIGRRIAVSVAYVRKDGRNFIGWTDVGGQYVEAPRLIDGRSVQVFTLVTPTSSRLFSLTNPEGYSLTYNGLVTVIEKRRSNGWQAFGSYTLSRAYGLQPYSGTDAAGPQVSTVGSPPVLFAPPITFGRDPNDLTNAGGRLPNDRPHMFRVMGSVDVPRTGFVVGANLQMSSGKPWAATAIVNLGPQNSTQRILLEPRGSRRLSAQSLLDVRVSRTMTFGGIGRIELMLDVLNALNDTAEEGLQSDTFSASNFGQPNVYLDPRRAMISARVNLGR
jgi:hypothetical protein